VERDLKTAAVDQDSRGKIVVITERAASVLRVNGGSRFIRNVDT